ncbi:MAG: hypothetical protein DRN90_06680 [Thermoproteota archaeon]|nr:MAG: hypothetical protein DRN90_06680 [Candidatus Korarchaeota archaeon]
MRVDMSYKWEKNGLSVNVMFSLPGVATQILVSAIEERIDLLLDCGCGTLRDLLLDQYLDEKGFSNIKAVLISHEHFDHVGGLYPLLDFMHMIGREESLEIMVPRPSTVAVRLIDALKTFRKSSLTYKIDLLEVSDGDEFQFGPMRVRVFGVVHRGSTKTEPIGPYIPAVGYSVFFNGIKIVYSGDTGVCDSLTRELSGADLAILEATWEEKKDFKEIHMSEEEAIKLGRTAKEFILIHRLRDLRKALKQK